MAANDIPFILGTPVHPSGTPDTVYGALDKMNQVINAYQSTIVTANGQSNGAITSGNVQLNGSMSAISLTVNAVGGGTNLSTPGVLNVTTNVAIGNVTLTGSGYSIGNSTVNVTANSIEIDSTTSRSSNNWYVGNSTVNTAANSSLLKASTINVATLNYTTGVFAGNSTVNVAANSSMVTINGVNVATLNNRASVYVNSTTAYAENKINISGGNSVTVSVTDDAADGLVNVSIAFTGPPGSTPPGGSNTNVQFNDSGSFGGSAGFTFTKTTNNATIGNTLTVSSLLNIGGNNFINTIALQVGNSSVATLVGNGQVNVGANVSMSTSSVTVGNSTVTVLVSNSVVNVGANVIVNTTTIQIGNSTVTSILANSQLSIGSNAIVNTSAVQVGNSTVNAVVNSSALTIGTSVVNSTFHAVGANVLISASNVSIGNSSVNSTVNSTMFALNGVNIVPTIATTSDIWKNTANLMLVTDKTRSALDWTSLTDAATVTFDANNGLNFTLTATSGVGSTRALGALKNGTNGMNGVLKYKQDGTGGRALTFGSSYHFNNATTPTINTTASTTTVYSWLVLFANSTVVNTLITVAATGVNF